MESMPDFVMETYFAVTGVLVALDEKRAVCVLTIMVAVLLLVMVGTGAVSVVVVLSVAAS
jgi:hypothetical protein